MLSTLVELGEVVQSRKGDSYQEIMVTQQNS